MSKFSQKYDFEALDDHSRRYLLQARDGSGAGMPGLFVPVANYLPAVGCFFGLVILVVMGIISWNQIEQEPLGVAMLQTVGILLGGWMIVAAIRIWIVGRSARYAGHFIYADADTLWECAGSTVTTTDLYGVIEAKGVHNCNNQGKYQNTAVTVQTDEGTRSLTLTNEENARRLVVFLNMLAWMRSGAGNIGEEDGVDFKKLPAPIMGGLARELAIHGELPRNWSEKNLDLEVDEVPEPRKGGRAPSGMLNYLIIIALAVGCVFTLKQVNVGLRDDSIWEHINKITFMDARAPWIRAYLSDGRNTRHRDEAQKMLRDIYVRTVARIRGANFNNNPLAMPVPNQFPNQVPRPNPIGVVNEVTDKELVDGLEGILLHISEVPMEIVSFSVKEKGGDKGAAERESQVLDKFTLAIKEGVGKELIMIAKAPQETVGMIDLTWEPARLRDANGGWQINFVISFRKTPDGEPIKIVSRSMPSNGDAPTVFGELGRKLGMLTAGPKRPDPPPEVFDD